MTLRCSLVIPCYNEAAGLSELVSAIRNASFNTDNEIILVNNGSTDDTSSVMSDLLINDEQIRFITVADNLGYGYGVLAGLKSSKGGILGWMHADLQTSPADVKLAFDKFKNDPTVEFIKGRRYGRPLADVFFTVGMNVFVSTILGVGLRDVNAQPTIFYRSFFESWRRPPHDFSLDLYAYYLAKSQRLSISRFAVYFGLRKFGHSNWNFGMASRLRFIQRTVSYTFKLRSELK